MVMHSTFQSCPHFTNVQNQQTNNIFLIYLIFRVIETPTIFFSIKIYNMVMQTIHFKIYKMYIKLTKFIKFQNREEKKVFCLLTKNTIKVAIKHCFYISFRNIYLTHKYLIKLNIHFPSYYFYLGAFFPTTQNVYNFYYTLFLELCYIVSSTGNVL